MIFGACIMLGSPLHHHDALTEHVNIIVKKHMGRREGLNIWTRNRDPGAVAFCFSFSLFRACVTATFAVTHPRALCSLGDDRME